MYILLNLQNYQKGTNCQGASHVSNMALAQRARSNLQVNVGKITKKQGKRDLLDNDKKGNDAYIIYLKY